MAKGQLITRIEPEPNIAVSAGTTQVHNIETLRNIHSIQLHVTGGSGGLTYAQLIADIDAIKINYGGQYIIDATPDFLWIRHHYDRDRMTVITPDGVVPISFIPLEFPLSQVSKYFRLGMKANADPASSKAVNLSIEITWASSVATATACVPYIEYDDDDPEPIGDHIRINPVNLAQAATGRQDITTLDRKSPLIALRRVYFPLAVGVVSYMEVIENNTFRLRNVPLEVLQEQQLNAGRVPQSAYTVADFTLGNDPTSVIALPSLNKLTVSPTWSTLPGNYTAYSETIARGLT